MAMPGDPDPNRVAIAAPTGATRGLRDTQSANKFCLFRLELGAALR